MRKVQVGLFLIILICLTLGETALSYYYAPGHVPPGPPPNYTEIDTSYFLGTPVLPSPTADSGGIYIWYDQGMWQIANHIYSKGNSLEQFHCCVLAILDQPPTPYVNVFAGEFELWGDTTDNRCLHQNDRWGWKPWGDNLYEIWWDVTTREWKEGEGDPNDFMRFIIAGGAVDFNVWSSGHDGPFDAHQVFLGANRISLSSIPEYDDYFAGIDDPYQSQVGSDPTRDPNITVFTQYSDTLRSFNRNGLIDSTDSHTCDLAVNYGQRYAGTFAYEGNGIQFSTQSFPVGNRAPHMQLPPDTSVLVCVADPFCVDIFASDPDEEDTITVQKTFGAGIYLSKTDAAPISDMHCFFPDTSGSYMFVFEVTDNSGLSDIDTTIITVDMNDPPVVDAPDLVFVPQGDTVEYTLTANDPDGKTLKDSVDMTVDPDCGEYSIERLSGWGTSTGEWRVTFQATDCVVGYHTAVVEVQDSCGCSGVDTTLLGIQPRPNNAPLVTVPEIDTAFVDSTIEYSAEAVDPDSDALLDDASIRIIPPCGNESGIRVSGTGTPSGTWEITFQTSGCNQGGHQVIVEIEDTLGAIGAGTTYVELITPTGIDEAKPEKVSNFFLKQNYPNPFNLRTEISFQLPYEFRVSLKVYNLNGQRVKTIIEREMDRGVHTLYWDGTDHTGNTVASGIYFYKLEGRDFVSVRKMVLLK